MVVLLLLDKAIFLLELRVLSSYWRYSFGLVPLKVLFRVASTTTIRLLRHDLLEHLILLIQIILLDNLSWGVLHAVSLFPDSRWCNVLLSGRHLRLRTVFQPRSILLLIFIKRILPLQLLLLEVISASVLLKVLTLRLLGGFRD